MHAGIDGWGRPFDYLAACRALNTDVMVLQEVWAEGGVDQAGEIARTLGYTALYRVMANARRIAPQPVTTTRWMPRLGVAGRKKSLYFGDLHPIPARTRASALYRGAAPGTLGVAVLVRDGLPLDGTRTLPLPVLPRDRVHRVAIVVDLTVDGVPVSVVGTHMAHLTKGSPHHYAELGRLLRTEARPDTALLADMNLWGPPLRHLLPGWRQAVKGRTWPAARPHSQIDHILVRGNVVAASSRILPDAGSDHRPVRAELALR